MANDALGNALGHFCIGEIAVDFGLRRLVKSPPDTHEIAMPQGALNSRAGDAGLTQFLCAQQRVSCNQCSKLLALCHCRQRYVTKPMIISLRA